MIAGWLTWGSMNQGASLSGSATTTVSDTSAIAPTAYECNGDGKVCEDGSIIGRTGPLCEFPACPTSEATTSTIRTTMGQKMTGLNVSITPIEITDDSRCPTDVQCIWAGTVHVRAKISTPNGSSEELLEIGHPVTKHGYTIIFSELTPAPKADETIPVSSYRFVFTVSK